MLAELRTRLGAELERLSRELEARMPTDLAADQKDDGTGADGLSREAIQRRIRLFGQLTAGLATVDPAKIAPDRAGYGSCVRVRDVATGDEASYTLMTGDFIDLDEGQISLESPIGHSLVGSRPGEVVSVATPRGERRYEVVSVVTLPALLRMPGTEGDDPVATAGSLQVA